MPGAAQAPQPSSPAVGLTVVTVSAGNEGTRGADVAAAGADVVTGAEVAVGADEVPVAETEPLSPPPRMMPVVPMARNRITPATPAIHIQRRSMLSSSYSMTSV